MTVSNFCKNFGFLLILIVFQACQLWQDKPQNSTNSTVSVQEAKSDIPFSTKEPETFQADFIFSDVDHGERKIFVARQEKKLRIDYEDGSSLLQLTETGSFLINHQHQIYAEKVFQTANPEKTEETLQDFLTIEWLNEKDEVKFESLPPENGLLKFKALLGASEVLIYFDENLQMPVKQEFLHVVGEQRDVLYRTEMKNFKPLTEPSFFELPKNYRQVSLSEYQQILWKDKFTEKHENK